MTREPFAARKLHEAQVPRLRWELLRVANYRCRRPAFPGETTLVIHSATDDVVPYPQGRAMARSWCAKGVRVRFDTSDAPTHVDAAVAARPAAFRWLEARFAGRPAITNCGGF